MTDERKDFRPSALVGSVGANYVREQLLRLPPKKAIEEIQRRNALKTPHCRPVMEFLELQGLDFNQQYGHLLVFLRQEMLSRIPSMGPEAINNLLEQTFPYIIIEELQEVPIALLKHTAEIPRAYLQFILSHPKIYDVCPLEVKRSIWLLDEKLLANDIMPLIQQYMNDPTQTYTENYILHNPQIRPLARREKMTALKEIVRVISPRPAIYNIFVNHLKLMYLRNPSAGLSSLRKDIVMAFHDNGFVDVCNQDKVYLLAWRLDTCCIDNAIDDRRIKELNSYFDGLGQNSLEPRLWGDIAMVLNHPSVIYLLMQSIYSTLHGIIERQTLPKNEDNLQFLTILANIGLSAHDIVVSGTYTPSRVERSLLNTFYPYLAGLILDRMMDNELAPDSVLEQFKYATKGNSIARKVFLFFIITRFAEKDYVSVEYLLPMLLDWGLLMSSEYPFSSTLVTICSQLKEIPGKLRKTVIHDFLIPLSGSCEKHTAELCRLLLLVQHRVGPKELRRLTQQCQAFNLHTRPDVSEVLSQMQARIMPRDKTEGMGVTTTPTAKTNPAASGETSNAASLVMLTQGDGHLDGSSDGAETGHSSDSPYSGSSSYRYDDEMREGETFM